jgi:hypothetical protein
MGKSSAEATMTPVPSSSATVSGTQGPATIAALNRYARQPGPISIPEDHQHAGVIARVTQNEHIPRSNATDQSSPDQGFSAETEGIELFTYSVKRALTPHPPSNGHVKCWAGITSTT